MSKFPQGLGDRFQTCTSGALAQDGPLLGSSEPPWACGWVEPRASEVKFRQISASYKEDLLAGAAPAPREGQLGTFPVNIPSLVPDR